MNDKNILIKPRNAMRKLGAAAPRAENGFTLIELMISLLLGSIIIVVIGGLFLANTNTFRALDDAGRLQENGRFALQTLSRVVRQAGFVPADVSQLVTVQNAAFPSNLGGIAGATMVAGTDNTGPNNSDTLTVAFRGATGGQIVDCSGAARAVAAPVAINTAATALPTPVVNRFYVAASVAAPASGNALWCDATVAGVMTQFELINGVESFQVLYAVDPPTGAGRTFSPSYFTSANNLNGVGFNAVMGVQVALVLRGGERSTQETARLNATVRVFGPDYDGTVNTDPGAIYTFPTTATDRLRAFRVLTTTINLRNRAA